MKTYHELKVNYDQLRSDLIETITSRIQAICLEKDITKVSFAKVNLNDLETRNVMLFSKHIASYDLGLKYFLLDQIFLPEAFGKLQVFDHFHLRRGNLYLVSKEGYSTAIDNPYIEIKYLLILLGMIQIIYFDDLGFKL